ncbi:MAG: T9SS type A sorting domain-containing protein [Bacteroidota bacterium]
MKIGKEQGSCIVLAERNYLEKGVFQSKVGPDQIDITNQYIMALALEYKLLTRNHQDASETIKELYHMLYAINRLDLEAEQFWTIGNNWSSDIIQSTGLLNGYMLREDMPGNFISQNFAHYNYSLLEATSPTVGSDSTFDGFTGVKHTNQLTNDNKFSGFFTAQEPATDLILPQDKYHTIMIAMMFIDKYIPQSISYNGEIFQDGEISIRQEARNIANRCYNYCKGQNNSWVLQLLNSSGNSVGNLPVGGSAFVYAWPLSRYACMANRDFPWVGGSNNSFCSGYNDPYAITSGRSSYNLMCQTPSPCFDDNAVFKAWSQAGSNSNPFLPGIGINSPIYLAMQQNTSLNNLEWADLLRKVLHQDGSLLRQLSVYGDPINSAPCQGPYNYSSCTHGGWEWSSQDRLEHPSSRGSGCGSGVTNHPMTCANQTFDGSVQGNYPGVDYMLLHNLYYEYQNQLTIDGNNGNTGGSIVTGGSGGGGVLGNLLGNVISVIVNSATNVINSVNSSICSSGIPVYFAGNNICDQIANNTATPYYAYNYMDNIDKNIWPRKLISSGPMVNSPNNIQGVDQTGLQGKVAVFQNLVSEAHIYAASSPAAPQNTIPSNVTYRAGKEIVLKSGFQVDQGSTYRAYIQRYICNGNNDALNMRMAKDSILLENPTEFDYESDNINPIPIHYYESPKSDSDNNPIVPEQDDSEQIIPDMTLMDQVKSSDFSLTPNPTTGKITLHTKKSVEKEIFSVHVYDMKGQLIYMYDNVTSDFDVSLEGYSKGIYMVQVISNLGNSITKKVDVVE